MLRPLTKDDVDITVTCLPEDEHPKDSFAFGDDEEAKAREKEIVDKILEDLTWNEWAWCVVKVTLRWRGFEAGAYLGGCSYKDEADFRGDVYFDTMVSEALAELNDDVAKTYAELKILETP